MLGWPASRAPSSPAGPPPSCHCPVTANQVIADGATKIIGATHGLGRLTVAWISIGDGRATHDRPKRHRPPGTSLENLSGPKGTLFELVAATHHPVPWPSYRHASRHLTSDWSVGRSPRTASQTGESSPGHVHRRSWGDSGHVTRPRAEHEGRLGRTDIACPAQSGKAGRQLRRLVVDLHDLEGTAIVSNGKPVRRPRRLGHSRPERAGCPRRRPGRRGSGHRPPCSRQPSNRSLGTRESQKPKNTRSNRSLS